MDYYSSLFASKVSGGGGGGSAVLINKNINANGTYNASSDNADGYKKVVVDVPNPSAGSINITQNGTYDVTEKASAVVDVPTLTAEPLSVTENGTYTAPEGKAYSPVSVNVSGGGGGGIPLPSGFTQLEYADTTGSTAVDLGKKFTYPSTGYTFFLLFDVLNSSNTQIVFTSGTTVSNTNDQLVLVSGRIRMDRTHSTTMRFPISVGDKIEYRSSYSDITNGGGQEYAYDYGNNCSFGLGTSANMRDITPAQTMKLFAEYKNSIYQTFATVRFRELMYKEGSTEIMHLYPVEDNNGTVCLYDTVGQTAIYPITGQFVQNAQELTSIGRTLLGE